MNVADITVITPTIPGRQEMLMECMDSVQAQTVKPQTHLVRMEDPSQPLGPVHLAHQRNAMLRCVTTEWTTTLDDDDRFTPDHFERIQSFLQPDVHAVYVFDVHDYLAQININDWSIERLLERLLNGNMLPSSATFRTSTLHRFNGWDEHNYDPVTRFYPTGTNWEDWDLWVRMAQADIKPTCVPIKTWNYRRGPYQTITMAPLSPGQSVTE